MLTQKWQSVLTLLPKIPLTLPLTIALPGLVFNGESESESKGGSANGGDTTTASQQANMNLELEGEEAAHLKRYGRAHQYKRLLLGRKRIPDTGTQEGQREGEREGEREREDSKREDLSGYSGSAFGPILGPMVAPLALAKLITSTGRSQAYARLVGTTAPPALLRLLTLACWALAVLRAGRDILDLVRPLQLAGPTPTASARSYAGISASNRGDTGMYTMDLFIYCFISYHKTSKLNYINSITILHHPSSPIRFPPPAPLTRTYIPAAL
jgi:hypothetical protein